MPAFSRIVSGQRKTASDASAAMAIASSAPPTRQRNAARAGDRGDDELQQRVGHGAQHDRVRGVRTGAPPAVLFAIDTTSASTSVSPRTKPDTRRPVAPNRSRMTCTSDQDHLEERGHLERGAELERVRRLLGGRLRRLEAPEPDGDRDGADGERRDEVGQHGRPRGPSGGS